MKHSRGSFTAIHGLRAASISWVVLGHTYVIVAAYASTIYSLLLELL